MKRVAASVTLLLVLTAPGTGLAATLRPMDSDGVNLRSGPGTAYKIVGGLAVTDSANVIADENGWFKVRTASGLEAWAAGWVSRINYEDEQAYGQVDTDELNIRKEPRYGAVILAQVHQDDKVRLLEMAGDWWRVRSAAGVEGWVAAKYMKRAPAPAPAPVQPATPPAQTTTPPAQTTTPPVMPPVLPVPSPPADVPPPPAPAWAVPVLPLQAPPAPRPAGPKEVRALKSDGVYAGRDRDAFDQLDTAKAGEKLTYLDAAEGWVKVRTPRGQQGWIPGPSVTVTEGKVLYDLSETQWTLGYAAPPAAQAPAPAPQAPPAPAPAPQVNRRMVQPPEGLRLRARPDLQGQVLGVLSQGEVLEVQDTKAPWLWVKSASGKTGWVHGDYTVPVAAPAPAPAPAAPAPAPASRPAYSGDLRATLRSTAAGSFQLEVETRGPLSLDPRAVGTDLVIPLPAAEAQSFTLPVDEGGARSLSLSPAGLTLSLERLPNWQVTQRTANKMVIALQPGVTAVAKRDLSDRTVYDFTVQGTVAPRTSTTSAGDVVVEFPGATLAALPQIPGVRWEVAAGAARAIIASRRPYALKRTESGFELDLYTAGLAGKVIVLDPGHGGPDGGAYNALTGVREKDVNLQVALRLRAALTAKGAIVYMTRASDTRPAPADVIARDTTGDITHVDLGYRTRMANELKADLFISIHHNSGGGVGTETFYTDSTLNGERSAAVAAAVQQALVKGLGSVNRGYESDLYYVTRTTDAPAILVEVGFVNHPLEGRLIKTTAYQEKGVQAMVQGLERFYSER